LKIQVAMREIRWLQYLGNLARYTKARSWVADRLSIKLKDENLAPAASADHGSSVAREADPKVATVRLNKPSVPEAPVFAVALHALQRHGGGKAAAVRQRDRVGFEKREQFEMVQPCPGVWDGESPNKTSYTNRHQRLKHSAWHALPQSFGSTSTMRGNVRFGGAEHREDQKHNARSILRR
jgi:hypothetical protein